MLRISPYLQTTMNIEFVGILMVTGNKLPHICPHQCLSYFHNVINIIIYETWIIIITVTQCGKVKQTGQILSSRKFSMPHVKNMMLTPHFLLPLQSQWPTQHRHLAILRRNPYPSKPRQMKKRQMTLYRSLWASSGGGSCSSPSCCHSSTSPALGTYSLSRSSHSLQISGVRNLLT